MANKNVNVENETTVDPEELVSVRIPKTREKQDPVFVGVNGQNIMIQRGVTVQIPLKFAKVLENKEEMENLALDNQEKISGKVLE